MMKFASVSLAAVLGLLICANAGAQPTQAVPATTTAPTVISYSNSTPSDWSDLPLGGYRVPETNVVISGHHDGVPLVPLLFGVPGILVEGATVREGNKETAAANPDAWQVNIRQQAMDLTQSLLASGRYGQGFTLNEEPGATTASVLPYVMVLFLTHTDIRPSVYLKVTLKRPGEPARTTLYVCCLIQPRPLSGDNGLTANGGAPLKALVAQQLQTAIDVMLHDLQGKYERDDSKLVTVAAILPNQRTTPPVRGYELSEDDTSIVFTPKISVPFVGPQVWVMDKSAISLGRK